MTFQTALILFTVTLILAVVCYTALDRLAVRFRKSRKPRKTDY